VRVYDVNLVPSQILSEAPDLLEGMEVVKAVETKLGDVVQTETIDLVKQDPIAFERCNEHVAASAFQQQSRQLHRLSFGTALMKTADQL